MDERIEKAIRENTVWNDLSSDVKQTVNKNEYHKKVVQYSIKNQYRYRGNLGEIQIIYRLIIKKLIKFSLLWQFARS